MQNGLSEGGGSHFGGARLRERLDPLGFAEALGQVGVRTAVPRRLAGFGVESARSPSGGSRSGSQGLAVQEQSMAGESLLPSPLPVVPCMDPSRPGPGG
jgi:hypothetical protein